MILLFFLSKKSSTNLVTYIWTSEATSSGSSTAPAAALKEKAHSISKLTKIPLFKQNLERNKREYEGRGKRQRFCRGRRSGAIGWSLISGNEISANFQVCGFAARGGRWHEKKNRGEWGISLCSFYRIDRTNWRKCPRSKTLIWFLFKKESFLIAYSLLIEKGVNEEWIEPTAKIEGSRSGRWYNRRIWKRLDKINGCDCIGERNDGWEGPLTICNWPSLCCCHWGSFAGGCWFFEVPSRSDSIATKRESKSIFLIQTRVLL